MSFVDEHMGSLVASFGLAAILQLFLIRHQISNIADPLMFFAITSAFSLALGVYAVDSIEMYARLLGYFCCFYIGFFAAVGKPILLAPPLEMRSGEGKFKLVVMIGCIVFFLANALVWAKSGLVILSDDPSLYKSTAYTDGFGFVRRINWSLGAYVLVAALYWYLWERSKAAFFWLVLAVVISIGSGSKSSLLPLVFALGLYFLNPFYPASKAKNIPNWRVLLFFLLLAAVPAAAVLLIEQDSLWAALNALLERLFYFGDVLLYWGQPDLRANFSKLGVLDYMYDTFGSILGMLRISDYSAPIGNQFVQFTLPVGSDFPDSLGPNLPFFVRGELFFSAWMAPLHALMIGWVYGRIRRAFTCYRGSNILTYTLVTFIVCLSCALPVEEGLFIGQVVDFFTIYTLVYVLASLINSCILSYVRSPEAKLTGIEC